ncbi:MAG: GNAT family N-acetyltransferase [Actinomycetota bacterium]|nr:GNAT family N-acetyltransferase [Actinomycetota bacterium]
MEEVDHAQPSVAAEIMAIQRAAYQVEADLIGFDRIPTLHETAGDIAALDLTVLGVRLHGELVGLVGYRRRGDVVEIDRVAVDPSQLRKGIASRLLQALHHREADAQRFEVSTGAANGPALALYNRFGYQRLTDDATADGLLLARFART